jgi:hypothetical protein
MATSDQISDRNVKVIGPPEADWILFGIWILEFRILELYLERQIAFIRLG